MMTNFLNWLDEVRVGLYEKTKTLKPEEAVVSINENGKKIADKYGINVSKSESIRSHYPIP